MHAHRLAVASTLIACALSANVHAQGLSASASVSITNLTFTLIDLAPLDGIAPSVQFLNGAGLPDASWFANVYTSSWNPEGNVNESNSDHELPIGTASILSPNEAGTNNSDGQLSVVMTASSLHLNASTAMDAASAATGLERFAAASIHPNYALDWDHWSTSFRYTLSANTALRIQGQYQLSAQAQGDETTGHASALAFLDFSGDSPATSFSLSQSVGSRLFDFPGSQTGAFDFFLGNKSGEIGAGNLTLSLAANVQVAGLASSVPEPTSIALMLAGLGVASVASRRLRADR